MFQYCVVFKVLFGEMLTTNRTLCSAPPSVNVLNNGVMIVVMTTRFTLHGFHHFFQCKWAFGLLCWCLKLRKVSQNVACERAFLWGVAHERQSCKSKQQSCKGIGNGGQRRTNTIVVSPLNFAALPLVDDTPQESLLAG